MRFLFEAVHLISYHDYFYNQEESNHSAKYVHGSVCIDHLLIDSVHPFNFGAAQAPCL